VEIRAYHAVIALLLVGVSAAHGQASTIVPRTLALPAVPASSFSALAVRNSVAADGSTLTLRPIKDGLVRELRLADGTLGRTIFKLFNAKYGTVSEAGGEDVSGVFVLDGMSLSLVYANGGSEILTIGAGRTVSISAKSADGRTACLFWFAAGHDFTAGERNAAHARAACPRQAASGVAAAESPDNPRSWDAFDRFYASFVVSHEGGYVENDGNGSPANYGINQGANPDIDVVSLNQPRAEQILYQRYWLASGADQLPSGLAMVHGDTAINMGVKAANELLAQSGGDPGAYLALRDERYRAIAAADPDKANYLSLWLERTDDLRNLIGVGDNAYRRPRYAQYPPPGYYAGY
jgi:hypothetical protein